MQNDTTSGQETDGPTDTTELRAQWEAFEFRVPAPGRVLVTNLSHGEEAASDHRYVVSVVEGAGATECTCPAFEYHCGLGERCKHMEACAAQPAVMQAATDGLRGAYPDDDTDAGEDGFAPIATDGGSAEDGDPDTDDEGDDLPTVTHGVETEFADEPVSRCEGCSRESLPGERDIVHTEECSREGLLASSHDDEAGKGDDEDTIVDDHGDRRPRRTERADFGGGDSTGVEEL